MNIKDIVITNGEEDKMFIYGFKFIMDKALNKFTDSINIFHKRYINGVDVYVLEFIKRMQGKIYLNKFDISKECLEKYIKFMRRIYSKDINRNDIHEFKINESGQIEVKFLNENIIKIVSYDNKNKRIFFILSYRELLEYIEKIESIHRGEILKEDITFVLRDIVEKYRYTLSKKEKDMLFLETLYIFINSALDLKDKKWFNNISNKIRKIESLY